MALGDLERTKTGARIKKREGEGRRREWEGKEETTNNPLFKNLHGR